MTNPHNLFLFENSEEEVVNKEMMEDLVEIVKNHIQTIKTENTEIDFLKEIER